MAIPNNSLSSIPVTGTFDAAVSLSTSPLMRYELGGIAIGDTSMGMMYQIWQLRLDRNDVKLSAPSVAEFILFSGTGITELDLAFDQSMTPIVSFVQDSASKLRWYDPNVAEIVVTTIPDATNPRVTLDDKHPMQSAASDVILAYLKSGGLYYRQQRDRFTIEYQLAATVENATYLIRIGMNNKRRLQFEFR